MEATTLYRFYDAAGQLLYVGITGVGFTRLQQHACRKSWWWEIKAATFEHFPSRYEATLAETRAIRTERPRRNGERDQRAAKRRKPVEPHRHLYDGSYDWLWFWCPDPQCPQPKRRIVNYPPPLPPGHEVAPIAGLGSLMYG
jgi:hypothetical protein